MDKNTKIILLAAGKGKRMESDEPKALLLFKDKPFIQHVLSTVLSLELDTKPVIVVGYKKEKIMEVLGTEKYEYAIQEEQLGTGHAVLCAKDFVKKEDKIVLVISVDQPTVSKETLENIILKHKEKNSTITIGTVVVSDFEDWRVGMYKHFGRIIRDVDGSVRKIVEFKDAEEDERKIKELNLAIYAFDSDWLWKNIPKLMNENAQGEYYLTDLVKIACDQGKKVEAVPVSNIIEAIHPNSKAELLILEELASKV
jgi:bifunctional UDP-N-acetylglucosamine pyrophosphorylase / glucosamine-1-phosphate N-acetyltransferase